MFWVSITIIVFATIYVTIRLVLLAIKFLREKKINLGQFRLYEGKFPDELLSARYLFKNMFEIPILFYLLCLINMNLNNYFSYYKIITKKQLMNRYKHSNNWKHKNIKQ